MSIFFKVLYRIFPSKQAQRVKPWFRDNGDKTLRWDYPLQENSIVFDLGGYEGQWASDIFAKYRCRILIFEPYLPYAKNITNRFLRNDKLQVYDFGLGKENQNLELFTDNDATSAFKRKGPPLTIEIKKASTFIAEHSITNIDLMKINIEGGEYDLLEELIESGLVKCIANIQVQFHDFVPNALLRMKAIQSKLSETHELTYQYEFVWENWKLKN